MTRVAPAIAAGILGLALLTGCTAPGHGPSCADANHEGWRCNCPG